MTLWSALSCRGGLPPSFWNAGAFLSATVNTDPYVPPVKHGYLVGFLAFSGRVTLARPFPGTSGPFFYDVLWHLGLSTSLSGDHYFSQFLITC